MDGELLGSREAFNIVKDKMLKMGIKFKGINFTLPGALFYDLCKELDAKDAQMTGMSDWMSHQDSCPMGPLSRICDYSCGTDDCLSAIKQHFTEGGK